MLLLPAIDIRSGRLPRGHESAAADGDPVAQAARFLAQGAEWLHVVDLDRALKTGQVNTVVVRRICRLPNARVQIGGNVDTIEWAEDMIDAGASRIVLGTDTALSGTFASLVTLVGADRTALNVDVRGGRPVVRATGHSSEVSAETLARAALHYGVTTVVYRDLDKDGRALGADLEGAQQLAAAGVAVIAAGGVAGLDELRDAKRRGLAGVIVGRSLNEGRFGFAEALACSR